MSLAVRLGISRTDHSSQTNQWEMSGARLPDCAYQQECHNDWPFKVLAKGLPLPSTTQVRPPRSRSYRRTAPSPLQADTGNEAELLSFSRLARLEVLIRTRSPAVGSDIL